MELEPAGGGDQLAVGAVDDAAVGGGERGDGIVICGEGNMVVLAGGEAVQGGGHVEHAVRGGVEEVGALLALRAEAEAADNEVALVLGVADGA